MCVYKKTEMHKCYNKQGLHMNCHEDDERGKRDEPRRHRSSIIGDVVCQVERGKNPLELILCVVPLISCLFELASYIEATCNPFLNCFFQSVTIADRKVEVKMEF